MNSLIVRQLREQWICDGRKLNPGTSGDALQSFEEKYGVRLPSDLREFFLLMNGMDNSETDDDLVRFWSIEEVKPVSEAAPAYFDLSYLPNAERLYLFADYSIWSHTYAISLAANLTSQNEVCVIGLSKPIFLAKSFSEFLSLYLDGKILEFLKS